MCAWDQEAWEAEQPLTSALYEYLLIDRDVAKASELVEAWDLERFVDEAAPGGDSEAERPG